MSNTTFKENKLPHQEPANQPLFPSYLFRDKNGVDSVLEIVKKMNHEDLWKTYTKDKVGYWVKTSYGKLYPSFYDYRCWNETIPEGFVVDRVGQVDNLDKGEWVLMVHFGKVQPHFTCTSHQFHDIILRKVGPEKPKVPQKMGVKAQNSTRVYFGSVSSYYILIDEVVVFADGSSVWVSTGNSIFMQNSSYLDLIFCKSSLEELVKSLVDVLDKWDIGGACGYVKKFQKNILEVYPELRPEKAVVRNFIHYLGDLGLGVQKWTIKNGRGKDREVVYFYDVQGNTLVEAVCNPIDEFDLRKGVEVCLGKLWEKNELRFVNKIVGESFVNSAIKVDADKIMAALEKKGVEQAQAKAA